MKGFTYLTSFIVSWYFKIRLSKTLVSVNDVDKSDASNEILWSKIDSEIIQQLLSQSFWFHFPWSWNSRPYYTVLFTRDANRSGFGVCVRLIMAWILETDLDNWEENHINAKVPNLCSILKLVMAAFFSFFKIFCVT